MATLDLAKAREVLELLFIDATKSFQVKQPPTVEAMIDSVCDVLFASATQSYREVLLGCCLARILDSSINIRHPYAGQGDDAFNGRTLDEKVVNPFLQEQLIPCSKGPYLASFRRNVKFVPETGAGLRDKKGYQALLAFLDVLEKSGKAQAQTLTRHLLYRLIVLREGARIPLAQISRLSLEQYDALLEKMLGLQSGGLVPVLLTVAMLRTIKACFNLDWEIEHQGINVSDKASGAGGDITVRQSGAIVLAIEVTERRIDKARLMSTFNTKVVEAGISDYLFVYSDIAPANEASKAARTYFSQGHEINFVQARAWMVNNLATLGSRCRALFTKEILMLLDGKEVPGSVKIAWNKTVRELASGG